MQKSLYKDIQKNALNKKQRNCILLGVLSFMIKFN